MAETLEETLEETGSLDKMLSRLDSPVYYELPLGDTRLAISGQLGRPLTLEFHGEIHCSNCGRKTKKSYQQGYCFPCARRLARCDICIVRPEKCHYHLGTCREPEWGDTHCMQPHIVYLANTSGLKVGITRQPQVPTRWIDQGATQALPIFQVANRYISGLIETTLAAHVADKTDWRKMLKGGAEPIDLTAARDRLLAVCNDEIAAIGERFGAGSITALGDESIVDIDYPVLAYPDKIKALNLDKTPLVEGVLQGIKGQYLILDTGVLNVRKYTSYRVTVRVGGWS